MVYKDSIMHGLVKVSLLKGPQRNKVIRMAIDGRIPLYTAGGVMIEDYTTLTHDSCLNLRVNARHLKAIGIDI